MTWGRGAEHSPGRGRGQEGVCPALHGPGAKWPSGTTDRTVCWAESISGHRVPPVAREASVLPGRAVSFQTEGLFFYPVGSEPFSNQNVCSSPTKTYILSEGGMEDLRPRARYAPGRAPEDLVRLGSGCFGRGKLRLWAMGAVCRWGWEREGTRSACLDRGFLCLPRASRGGPPPCGELKVGGPRKHSGLFLWPGL